MTPRFCKGLAVLVALAASPVAIADDALDAWAVDRAREHAAALAGAASPAKLPEGQLYRTRPPTDLIPNFVAPSSLAPLVLAVRAGVVNISTTNVDSRGSFFSPRSEKSLGSGFVLSEDGFVVTNNHVIQKAESISVRLADGREFAAEIVGADPSTDVALLRLRGKLGTLPTVYLGDSDGLSVGDWVVAIGNPFGLDHSVAHGMISAKERVIGVGEFDDFIQTDALINPGNSGGPLFNMRGEVVGVTTAIISQGQGIGFAVPINMVKDLLPNLRANGRLARGWLGVNIHGVGSAPDPTQKGALVKDIYRHSPASKAGLMPGDRVLAVNGRPVESYLQLLRRLAILAPGSDCKLTVQRPGGNVELTVRLVERPAPETLELLTRANEADPVGLLVRQRSARDPGSVLEAEVVVVSGVMPGSPAERAGITAGDLISEVNRRKVTNLSTWKQAVEKAASEPTLLLRIQRGETTRLLAVERQ